MIRSHCPKYREQLAVLTKITGTITVCVLHAAFLIFVGFFLYFFIFFAHVSLCGEIIHNVKALKDVSWVNSAVAPFPVYAHVLTC